MASASQGHGGWLESHTTTLSLILGICISVAFGYLMLEMTWYGFSFLFEEGDIIHDSTTWWLLAIAGRIVWIASILLCFKTGLFKVEVGYGGYFEFLGVPIQDINLTPGYGWMIPWLMSTHIESLQGIVIEVVVDTMSKSGVNIRVKLSGLLYIANSLLFQKISREDAKRYAHNMIEGKLRAYILEQGVDDFKINKDKPLDDAARADLIMKLTVFKTEFVKNGVEEIRRDVGAEIADHGLGVREMTIAEIDLPSSIQNTITRYFDEQFQQAMLVADVTNKAEVAKILSETYKKVGIDFDRLEEKLKVSIVDKAMTFAFAAEGQAKVSAFYGGQGKKGPMVITTTN